MYFVERLEADGLSLAIQFIVEQSNDAGLEWNR
jgi:hypothetical protein